MQMEKVGRNDSCPCGSGRKYKQCCLPRKAGATTSRNQGVGEPSAIANGRDLTSSVDLNNLGLSQQNLGKLEDAVESYRKALLLRPNFAEAHYNLGNALNEQGRLADAVAAYQSALKLKPDFALAHCNLATTLRSLGDPDAALSSYVRALRISELREAKIGFAACLTGGRVKKGADKEFRQLVIRANVEGWGMPGDLAAAGIRLVKSRPQIMECIERVTRVWPKRLVERQLYGPSGPAEIADDLLFRRLLEDVQIGDLDLEKFLTQVRYCLLHAAEMENAEKKISKNLLTFYCAVSQQCFINEYCYSVVDDEVRRADALRERLAASVAAGMTGDSVHLLLLVSVAAYFPLKSLPDAAMLLSDSWPDAISRLLAQQVQEPMEEMQIRPTILKLTAVDDEDMHPVRQQYEENPYPRWVKMPSAVESVSINTHLRRQFPHASMQPLEEGNSMDILIAGCGTGRHAIETAQQISRARVLAVDLSLSSLCYATRKTREFGIFNIEYAHADIMKLSSIDRRFDVIESVGVLHHLNDPVAGWQTLRSLLRPSGFMRLGFYSEAARKTVIAARRFIAQREYRATPEDIRRCRQELMSAEGGLAFRELLSSVNFFGTSECRDLLFNVQEHRFTLPQIKTCLKELDLSFIGFSLAPDVLYKYRKRFPDDKTMANLDSWHDFETDNPNTFAGMYQFWVQDSG
jgi:SAM-dependent methyltransferase/tetratricopeptide (TPR) repeat protein